MTTNQIVDSSFTAIIKCADPEDRHSHLVLQPVRDGISGLFAGAHRRGLHDRTGWQADVH